ALASVVASMGVASAGSSRPNVEKSRGRRSSEKAAAGTPDHPGGPSAVFGKSVISGLGARNIGSATMSGRIAAVAARPTPDGKVELFVGAASGGVCRSRDGGTTVEPVSDNQPVQSNCAPAIDPTRPHSALRVTAPE